MWPLTGQTLKPMFGQSMSTGAGGKEDMVSVVDGLIGRGSGLSSGTQRY